MKAHPYDSVLWKMLFPNWDVWYAKGEKQPWKASINTKSIVARCKAEDSVLLVRLMRSVEDYDGTPRKGQGEGA